MEHMDNYKKKDKYEIYNMVIYVLSLSTDPTQLRWLTRQKMKKIKKYKNENCQKHIILVNLGLREYQNRIQHVHKSAHAKYELCSCQERRVMTSLRQNRYLRIQGRMQIFRSISCF